MQTTTEAIDSVRDGNIADYNDILQFATVWTQTQFKAFTSEELKSAYYLSGYSVPNETRVFGAVFRQLSRNGLIFRHGFKISENPVCHSRPQTCWVSYAFRLKQQQNRTQDITIDLFYQNL